MSQPYKSYSYEIKQLTRETEYYKKLLNIMLKEGVEELDESEERLLIGKVNNEFTRSELKVKIKENTGKINMYKTLSSRRKG